MNIAKQNECKYILHFLSEINDRNKDNPIKFTEIIQCSNDPPDFNIRTKNKSISIEITTLNIFTGLSKKQFCLNNVIKKVIKKIDKELPQRYDLKLGEGLDWKILDINENKLTEQIFQIVENFDNLQADIVKSEFIEEIREINKNRYLINFKSDTGNELGLFLSKVNTKYSTGGAAIVAVNYLNHFDIVTETILKKERKLPNYQKQYDANYLLLVTDPFTIQGCTFSFDETFYNHQFKTDFDKVYLMEIDWNYQYRVTELKSF